MCSPPSVDRWWNRKVSAEPVDGLIVLGHADWLEVLFRWVRKMRSSASSISVPPMQTPTKVLSPLFFSNSANQSRLACWLHTHVSIAYISKPVDVKASSVPIYWTLTTPIQLPLTHGVRGPWFSSRPFLGTPISKFILLQLWDQIAQLFVFLPRLPPMVTRLETPWWRRNDNFFPLIRSRMASYYSATFCSKLLLIMKHWVQGNAKISGIANSHWNWILLTPTQDGPWFLNILLWPRSVVAPRVQSHDDCGPIMESEHFLGLPLHSYCNMSSFLLHKWLD